MGNILTENAGLFVGTMGKRLSSVPCDVYRYAGARAWLLNLGLWSRSSVDKEILPLKQDDRSAEFRNIFYSAEVLGRLTRARIPHAH